MPRQRPLRDDDYGQAAADAGLDDLEDRCQICGITESRHPESLRFFPTRGEPTEGGTFRQPSPGD